MDIDFDIQLEERLNDRVFVSVVLGPNADPVHIDGVSVEILRRGNAVSPRLILPIAGTLGQPIGTTVELRALGPIPQGSRVVGTAWSGCSKIDVSCPCDPWTELEGHMRGTRLVALNERKPSRMCILSRLERLAISTLFPWVDDPLVRKLEKEPVDLVIAEDHVEKEDDLVGDICGHYDLDGADAEFLRELLAEE